jgi:hypothetical protein
MFANDDRFDEEKLRLRLSDVKREELELLGVICELPKLLDGLGTSYESSILLSKLVAVLDVERTECRLIPNCFGRKFSLLATATAGFGMS